ncbi:MAG: CAP domain-containing protein [Rhodospirillales bacterium]
MRKARWCAALAVAAALAAGPGASPAAAPGTLVGRSLDLVNAARRNAGLPPLVADPALSRAARAHAADMLRRGYFDHRAPDGATIMDRYGFAIRGGGAVAENIARCRRCPVPADARAVGRLHDDWMASPGHRRNILGAGFDRYGFGIAEAEDGTRYAVEAFAGSAP